MLEKHGAQGRDRTTDTAIFNRMLYQLSYLGAEPFVRVGGISRRNTGYGIPKEPEARGVIEAESGPVHPPLEHDPEKWTPVFRGRSCVYSKEACKSPVIAYSASGSRGRGCSGSSSVSATGTV